MKLKVFEMVIAALCISMTAHGSTLESANQKFFSCKIASECTFAPEYSDCGCPCDIGVNQQFESQYEAFRKVACKDTKQVACNKICPFGSSVACVSGKCVFGTHNDPDLSKRVQKLWDQSDLVVVGKLKLGACLDGCQGSIQEIQVIKGKPTQVVTLRPGSIYPIPFIERSKIWFLKNLGETYEPIAFDTEKHRFSTDSRAVDLSICQKK